MTDDLMKRLREGAYYEYDTALMKEAADEIERLRTENARLRAALRVIAKLEMQTIALDALYPNTDRKR